MKERVNLNEYCLSEGSLSEKTTVCMVPTMTFWKRQNYGESKMISGCQEFKGTGWSK
jgi:hypothetical protein